MTFALARFSYAVSEPDNVLDIADAWYLTEFNVFGDGGWDMATFNPGASLVVKIAVDEAATGGTRPYCIGGDGQTGETNSLTVHGCTRSGGSRPFIEFAESD